jgi:hypothetical protein
MIEAIVEKMRGIKIKGQPHASRGGRAYPKEVREMVIEMMLSGGIAAVKSQVVKQLRAQKKFPCFRLVGGGSGSILCVETSYQSAKLAIRSRHGKLRGRLLCS